MSCSWHVGGESYSIRYPVIDAFAAVLDREGILGEGKEQIPEWALSDPGSHISPVQCLILARASKNLPPEDRLAETSFFSQAATCGGIAVT